MLVLDYFIFNMSHWVPNMFPNLNGSINALEPNFWKINVQCYELHTII